MVPALHLKRVVLKVQAAHRGVGWYGVQAFFAPGTEELQGRVHVHLGVVELGDGRWRHQVTLVDHDGIVVAARDGAQLGNVFVQAHMHQAVFGQRMHLDCLAPTRLQLGQRLGHGHLVHQDLFRGQRQLGYAVACLDQRRIACFLGSGYAGGARKKAAYVDGIGGVIRPLVNYLEHIVQPDDAGRYLHTTRAPAVRKWHFARSEWHLVAGHRHGFEQGAAYAFFGALVQKRKVVVAVHHAASCCCSGSDVSACAWLARSLRTSSSSAWKST